MKQFKGLKLLCTMGNIHKSFIRKDLTYICIINYLNINGNRQLMIYKLLVQVTHEIILQIIKTKRNKNIIYSYVQERHL